MNRARACLLALLGAALPACGNYDSIVVVDEKLPAPPAEEGRIAEAIVALPTEASFYYDITLSGFASEGDIDLAVLREYCRPGRLLYVAEAPVLGAGSVSAEMYTPREISIRCSKGLAR